MTTILAAIDDSAAAKPVLATAVAMAPVFAAEVRAVQVADAPGRTAEAAAATSHTPLLVVGGDPVDEICRLAAEEDTVAVVVGARDRPRGTRAAGHLALAVADLIAKPVVVVPPEARPPARITRVLIALEGSTRSRRRLQRAVELAAASDLDMVVVHVDDEGSIPSFSDQVQYDTEVYATEFLARYAPGAPEARLEMRVGVPADEILAAVEQVDADMLAIGWPQSDDPGRGVVAREIIGRVTVPVFLVALSNG